MDEIVMWIIISMGLAIFLLITWALLVMASHSDEISDEDWAEYCRRIKNERRDDDGH